MSIAKLFFTSLYYFHVAHLFSLTFLALWPMSTGLYLPLEEKSTLSRFLTNKFSYEMVVLLVFICFPVSGYAAGRHSLRAITGSGILAFTLVCELAVIAWDSRVFLIWWIAWPAVLAGWRIGEIERISDGIHDKTLIRRITVLISTAVSLLIAPVFFSAVWTIFVYFGIEKYLVRRFARFSFWKKALLVGCALTYWMRSMWKNGWLVAQATDHRRPTLYLRSFSEEEVRKVDEKLLSETFEEFGPFVAIGTPNEAVSSLGAARYYCDSQEDWKKKVSDAFEQAVLTVIQIPNGSHEEWRSGIVWELFHCIGNPESPSSKVVLYFGIDEYSSKRRRELLLLLNKNGFSLHVSHSSHADFMVFREGKPCLLDCRYSVRAFPFWILQELQIAVDRFFHTKREIRKAIRSHMFYLETSEPDRPLTLAMDREKDGKRTADDQHAPGEPSIACDVNSNPISATDKDVSAVLRGVYSVIDVLRERSGLVVAMGLFWFHLGLLLTLVNIVASLGLVRLFDLHIFYANSDASILFWITVSLTFSSFMMGTIVGSKGNQSQLASIIACYCILRVLLCAIEGFLVFTFPDADPSSSSLEQLLDLIAPIFGISIGVKTGRSFQSKFARRTPWYLNTMLIICVLYSISFMLLMALDLSM